MAKYIHAGEARATLIVSVVTAVAIGTLIGFGLAYQRAASKIETACLGNQSSYVAELERSVTFWRNLALRMRTDGIESTKPVGEGDL